MLRFDPEDQAVLSPALNTAFVFPADTGDGYPSPGTSVGPDLSGFFTWPSPGGKVYPGTVISPERPAQTPCGAGKELL